MEIRDYSHYNFVTPIIKPDNMTREDVLKGVLRNYARFYSWKFLEYWFEPNSFKRRYLLGCLWAFVKTTLNRMVRKSQANSYVIPSKILVLVSPDQLSVVSDLIAAGADALYLKDAPIEQLANAVRIIHRNGIYHDPGIASLLEIAGTA